MKVLTNIGMIEADEDTLIDIMMAFKDASEFAYEKGLENLSLNYSVTAIAIENELSCE